MTGEKDSLLQRWKARSRATKEVDEPVILSSDADPVLSTGQARLYFLQSLFPANPFYHYADLYSFSGEVDIQRLVHAFQRVVQDRPILRTNFVDDSGKLVQKVQSELPCNVKYFQSDLVESQVISLARDYAREPFDLGEGSLVRLGIFPNQEGCEVLICMHHIIVDKWSMNVIRTDWAAYYTGEGAIDQQGRLTYADYAAWERQRTRSATSLAYWKNKLAGEISPLSLPVDRRRNTAPTFSGAFAKRSFNPEESNAILKYATGAGITPFVFFLAVFKCVLHRYSQEEDLFIGTPFTNRDRPSLESLVGFFNDTLVIRSQIIENQSLRDVVKDLQETVYEAFSHKDVTFEQVVNALDIDRNPVENPLFRTMFLYHEKDDFPSFSSSIEVKSQPFDLGIAKFDLTLYVELYDGTLSTYVEYDTDLFDRETINRIIDHLHLTTFAFLDDDTQQVKQIHTLTSEEAKVFEGWDRRNAWMPDLPNLIEQIQRSAGENPARPAIIHQNQSLDYSSLTRKANQVAKALLAAEVSSNFVGVLLEPGLAILPSIIGCIGSGKAYVPLDPSYPDKRLRHMVEKAGVDSVISQAPFLEKASGIAKNVINYDNLQEADTNLLQRPTDEQMVYLIFTSGSTGLPKGVGVSYANLLVSTRARFEHYTSHPIRFLLMSSISFDSSVAGIFWTLWSGGTLVTKPARSEQDLHGLARLMKEQKITHTLMLPSLYGLLIQFAQEDDLSSLQEVIVAGEACTPAIVDRHFQCYPEVGLHNEYGPTEATVWCSVHRFEAVDRNRLAMPIGRPIAGTKLMVLDRYGRPSWCGAEGQLYVAGPGVTAGYVGQQGETNKRFLNLQSGEDLVYYATGDRVSYDSDGLIYFRGRIDQQVKIRGYRIETAEVEQVILGNAEVQSGAVLILNKDKNPQLVAYYTGDLNADALRSILKDSLPDYMVPSKIIQQEELPKLPNGKVDRKTLFEQAPEQMTEIETGPAASSKVHPIEEKLTGIWKQVLGLESVGRNQNYFALGGDSIKSIQIIALAREAGIKIGPASIFKNPTIAELALFSEPLTDKKQTFERHLGRGSLSPMQSWFFEMHNNAPHFWNQGYVLKLADSISVEALYQCCRSLVNHHDVLRSAFLVERGDWIVDNLGEQQSLAGQWHLVNERDMDVLLREVQEDYQLSQGQPIQFFVQEDEYSTLELTIIVHHLVIDAVSWQIVLSDLDRLLTNKVDSEDLNLGDHTMGYQAWTQSIQAKAAGLSSSDIEFWQKQVSEEVTLPVSISLPIVEQEVVSVTRLLEGDLVDNLYTDALTPYGNHVLDFLVLAVLRSWKGWTGQTLCNLLMEGHGRDTEGLDVNQTVGWFTNFYPLLAKLDAEAIGDQLKYVKELLASSRPIAWQYGVLRHAKQDESNKSMVAEYHPSQIVVNYLGDQRSTKAFDTIVDTSFMMQSVRHPQSERHYALELNIARTQAGLSFVLSRSRMINDDLAQAFHEGILKELAELVQFCLHTDETGFTPSDFDEVELSQDELDDLLSSF